MSPHVDILEEPDRLTRPFWMSVIFHVSLGAALFGYAWSPIGQRDLIGSPNPGGGGFGSAVTVQPIVALPSSRGPENPVASDTESMVPPAPSKPKPQPKVIQPKRDAIALKGAPKKASRTETSQRNTFQEKQQYRDNQVFAGTAPKVSSSMYGMPGAGVGPGENSPFGTQFGWYASLLQRALANNWKTAGLDARSQTAPAVVTFRILRDGSLAPGLTKVSQSSGNRALDDSALRAVLDSAPFPALPPGFPRNQADVEFFFELRR